MEGALLIIIYALLIVFLIIAIIIGIKLLFTINKIDELLNDVSNKIKSLDKVFEIVDFATDRMSMVTEVAISFLTTGFKKLFGSNKKKKKKTKEEEEDYE